MVFVRLEAGPAKLKIAHFAINMGAAASFTNWCITLWAIIGRNFLNDIAEEILGRSNEGLIPRLG